MLFDPTIGSFVERLFDQVVLLPVLVVGMIVFIRWLWWTLEGSGIRQGPGQ